jgi:hypothetical protein
LPTERAASAIRLPAPAKALASEALRPLPAPTMRASLSFLSAVAILAKSLRKREGKTCYRQSKPEWEGIVTPSLAKA